MQKYFPPIKKLEGVEFVDIGHKKFLLKYQASSLMIILLVIQKI